MQTYHGSCHCGAVTYTVTGDFTEALRCNCSHCKRKGFLLAFVPDEQFDLKTGGDNETVYRFNKHFVDHTFCKTCGVQSHGHGHDGQGHYMTMINLNCLENFDTSSLKINDFDGASM